MELLSGIRISKQNFITISLAKTVWRKKNFQKRYEEKTEPTSMKFMSISVILRCTWRVCFTELGAVFSSYLFWKIFFLETVFASEIAMKFCYKMSLIENNSICRFGCGGGFMLLLHPVYPNIPIIKLGAVFSWYLFWKFFFLQTVFASEIVMKFCIEMSITENNSIYRFGCGGGGYHFFPPYNYSEQAKILLNKASPRIWCGK